MDLFSKVDISLIQKLPFALYSKPNCNEIVGIFQNDDTLFQCSNFSEKGFVFVSFDFEQKVILPIEDSEIIVEKIENFTFENKDVNEQNFSEETKKNYENLVKKAVNEIQKGDYQKIVTSRKETVALEINSVSAIFKKLVNFYPTAFRYCFYHPKVGIWLGATPEQLLKVTDKKIQTVALAGTKTLDKQNEEWGKKEQHEQQLVTDYIINNLESFVDNLEISEPYTYQAGKLLHIKTDIFAEIVDKSNFEKVIEKLHPTPAVCGFPKEKAKKFILENEGYNREFYAGFLGELNYSIENKSTENSDLFVNLRCMKLENDEAHLFVGGGITAESNPEKEFFETVNKTETIKKVL